MKKLAILTLLALEFAVGGCANNTPSTTVTTQTNATWEAQLTGGTGPTSQLNFVTTFSVTNTNGGASQPLDNLTLGFYNAGACFGSPPLAANQTETGSATLTASSTNQVTGTLTLTVTSVTGNTLTLTGNVTGTSNGTTGTTGTLSNGVVQGTWQLAGSCAGTNTTTGPFLMCQGTDTCTAP